MKGITMVKKAVLAYSGGLDTSVIVRWLIETYDCEVVCFAADVGQKEELTGLKEKAINTGASKIYIEDLREEFLTDYVFPTMQAGAIYEHKYLLGTSFARPIIAKGQVEIADINTGVDCLLRARASNAASDPCTGRRCLNERPCGTRR